MIFVRYILGTYSVTESDTTLPLFIALWSVLNGMMSGEHHNGIFSLLLDIEKEQSSFLGNIEFGGKVSLIYNPLQYASQTHEDYLKKYCQSTKSVLFLGLNPGPFGMAQNGVPFGDTHFVKNWLNVEGYVQKPEREHPRKIIHGLDCKRSEVSGKRFWGFLEDICKTPNVFFNHCFVHNYCPLVFMSSTGKNITPPEIQINERKALLDICDNALLKVIKLLQVQVIVGIGKFAESRAKGVVKNNDLNVNVLGIMHPSPINPSANSGWKEVVTKQLDDFGIMHYLLNS